MNPLIISPQPAACDEALVALQVVLDQSLLQYVSEARLWVDAAHAGATKTLKRLAEGQRESASDLADLLASRRLLPELATFRSEYAQWHYLALAYLIERVVADQQRVVAVAQEAVSACAATGSATSLEAIMKREVGHLDELRRLGELLRGSQTE